MICQLLSPVPAAEKPRFAAAIAPAAVKIVIEICSAALTRQQAESLALPLQQVVGLLMLAL